MFIVTKRLINYIHCFIAENRYRRETQICTALYRHNRPDANGQMMYISFRLIDI